MARPTPTPTPTTTPTAAPRPVRGRRPEREQAALRERIEALMLQGLPASAIHRALTGPESPNPSAISERQVRAHKAAIERAWAARASREHLEAEHAKAIAMAEETVRTALGRSTLNARSNLGYLNTSLKAQELVARLRGLYAPSRAELSGPSGTALAVSVALADHPADHLDPREEARRLRQMAADREAEADETEGTA
jgi:hypothetical protein